MINFKGLATILVVGSVSLSTLAMTEDYVTGASAADAEEKTDGSGQPSLEDSPHVSAVASSEVSFTLPHPDYELLTINVTGPTREAALHNLLEQIRWLTPASRQKVWESLEPILQAQEISEADLWFTEQLVVGKLKPTTKAEVRDDLASLQWRIPYEQRETHPLLRPLTGSTDYKPASGLLFSHRSPHRPAGYSGMGESGLTGVSAILALGTPYDTMRVHPYLGLRRGHQARQALQWHQDFPRVFSTALNESRTFRPGYALTLPLFEDSDRSMVTTNIGRTPWKAVRASLKSLAHHWPGFTQENQLWLIEHLTHFLECTLPSNRASSEKVWEDWILSISTLGHDEEALYLAQRQVKDEWNPRAGLAGLVLAQHRAKRADLAAVYPILSQVALILGDEEVAWRAHEVDWRMRHHHRNLFPELDLYMIEEGIARTFALNPDYVDPELGILYAFTLGGDENRAKGRAYFSQALEKMEKRHDHFNNENAESMFWLDQPNAVRLFIAAIDLLWDTREAYRAHPLFQAVVQDRVTLWGKIAAARKTGEKTPIPSEANIIRFVEEGVDAFKHLLCLAPGTTEEPTLAHARTALIERLPVAASLGEMDEIHRITHQLQVITPRTEADFINYVWLMRHPCQVIFSESTAHVLADLVVPRDHALAMKLYQASVTQDNDGDAEYAIGDFQHTPVVRSKANRHTFLPDGWESLI